MIVTMDIYTYSLSKMEHLSSCSLNPAMLAEILFHLKQPQILACETSFLTTVQTKFLTNILKNLVWSKKVKIISTMSKVGAII